MPPAPSRRLALFGAGLLLAPIPRPAGAWAWLLSARLPDPRDPATTLNSVEDAVSRLVPVPEITVPALAARMTWDGPRPLVLFDVRTAEEFATGHLPGAIRIEPELSSAAFAAAHGQRVAGADVVLYCAVGWRSGVLIDRLRGRIASHASASMANLRGGVFRWHAEGLKLTASSAPGFVHPFDEAWGVLLNRIVPRG
ncbi:rhodanese-like domain-containing protein [Elioraea sp.]|uniref:rhodanese-like domain-containing protein n=1 Tax=Elioraea sp. TaxID=2185103 RepID=UPI0025B7BD3E|nr:rhodanese-like domain-containing protein [Elioraea sp.]